MALALLFAGQGAQKVGMGRTLAESSPAAKALYDEAAGVLGWDLARVSFEGPEAELTQTRVCQPALFVHGLALVAALREKGLLPAVDFALGLSLGEVTAYAAAGVFDFAAGLRIVAERGRLMQQACEQSAGGMAAVIGETRGDGRGPVRRLRHRGRELQRAGPDHHLGGAGRGCGGRRGREGARDEEGHSPPSSPGAYHSRLMEPARAAFEAFLGGITFSEPRLRVFTNTTGGEIKDPAEIKRALVKQVVSPVLWEDCMRCASAAGATEFWELGPGAVLAGLARRTDKAWKVRSFSEYAELVA